MVKITLATYGQIKYIFLLFLLAIPVILTAANLIRIDSLKRQLNTINKIQKLEILQSLTREYLYQSTDSCLKYGLLTVGLARELADKNKEAIAYKQMGYSYFRAGDPDLAIEDYKKSVKIFNEEKEYLNETVVTNFLGLAYEMKSDYATAINYFVAAERNCDSLIENYPDKSSVIKLYSIIYTNKGLLYHELDSIAIALEYFNKALTYATEINDSNRIAASFSNIGMIYKGMKKFDDALNEYFKSLRISRKTGNLDYQKATLNNIAATYYEMSVYDSVMYYYTKSLELIQETGDKYGQALVNRNIADIYLMQKNYMAALEKAYLSLEFSREVGSLTEIYLCDEILSDIYKAKKDYKNAYYYYTQFSALKDSVSGIKTLEKIAEIQTSYETEKKENENIMLKNKVETEKQKSFYFLLTVIVLLIVGILSLILFYLMRRNAVNKKKIAESEAARLEDKVDHQKRELVSSTLTLSKNLEFINSLIADIKELADIVESDQAYITISKLIKKLEQQNADRSWEEFETRFQEIHRKFYQKLHDNFSGLTPNDVKLCALLKLGMNTKDICSVTFQSIRAVEAARLRLRKKLHLKKDENLSIFLQRF